MGQDSDVPEKKFSEFPLSFACLLACLPGCRGLGLGLENWVRARLGRPLCQHHLISPNRAHAHGRTGTFMAATWDLYPSIWAHLLLRALMRNHLEATRASARALGFLQPHRCLPSLRTAAASPKPRISRFPG